MSDRPRCYAQRLLSPFRGVMNIIEYRGAEAVTIDGRHWDIYVRDTLLVADLANSHRVQTSDIRYGSWSTQQGLKRGALYPSEDFKQLEKLGSVVYDYLLRHHERVPFPLEDRYELWLLDTAGAPLALLGSAISEQDMELDLPLTWRAGRECSETFKVGDTAAAGTTAADSLAAQVNARAGKRPRGQWFLRTASGDGRGLAGINLTDELHSRSLPAAAFPPLLVAEPADTPERTLLQAFFDWQSPCLLLLPGLDDAQRRGFEHKAARRALAVEKHHRLYPQVIDAETLRAARVEALLRAGEPGTAGEDEAMATYYIELNVTRTN